MPETVQNEALELGRKNSDALVALTKSVDALTTRLANTPANGAQTESPA